MVFTLVINKKKFKNHLVEICPIIKISPCFGTTTLQQMAVYQVNLSKLFTIKLKTGVVKASVLLFCEFISKCIVSSVLPDQSSLKACTMLLWSPGSLLFILLTTRSGQSPMANLHSPKWSFRISVGRIPGTSWFGRASLVPKARDWQESWPR